MWWLKREVVIVSSVIVLVVVVLVLVVDKRLEGVAHSRQVYGVERTVCRNWSCGYWCCCFEDKNRCATSLFDRNRKRRT